MDFYEISLLSVPKTEFVYNVEKQNYHNSFPSSKKLLEITLCLEGNIITEFPCGKKEISVPGSVSVYIDGTVCRTYAEKSGLQRHITFGVAADVAYKRYTDSAVTLPTLKALEERVKKSGSILIPHRTYLGENAKKVEKIISGALPFFYSPEPADSLKCISVWYELCAYLTEYTLRTLRRQFFEGLPSDEMYAEAAVYYISEHLSEDIAVADIAKSIGISMGYLQNTFKKITGLTLTEYINRERIELIKGYTENDRMTLAAAAALAGIEDASYASRLFKKVSGLSFAQYRDQCKTKRENTVSK